MSENLVSTVLPSLTLSKIFSYIIICRYKIDHHKPVTVPSTYCLNQLWIITIQARAIPASKTLDIQQRVRATLAQLLVFSAVEEMSMSFNWLMKMASTREINDNIINRTTVSCLGFSMLSYTLPRKMKPIPAEIVTLYLNSLQVSPSNCYFDGSGIGLE